MVTATIIFGAIGAIFGLLLTYGMNWIFGKTQEIINMPVPSAWMPDWIFIGLIGMLIFGVVGLIIGAKLENRSG